MRRLTSRRSQPPLALAVPLSRFTTRVGGGSAFFVSLRMLCVAPSAIRMRRQSTSPPWWTESRRRLFTFAKTASRPAERLPKPVIGAAPPGPGRAVFVHCGVLSVGVRKKLGLPSPFDMRFSNPIDLHAVALRYPELPFIVPHFGAGYFREALMLAGQCPNVYLDTSSTNNWMRYDGLDLKTVFARALDVAGASRLLFGTDSSFFPCGWNSGVFEAQARALLELGIGAEDAGVRVDRKS